MLPHVDAHTDVHEQAEQKSQPSPRIRTLRRINHGQKGPTAGRAAPFDNIQSMSRSPASELLPVSVLGAAGCRQLHWQRPEDKNLNAEGSTGATPSRRRGKSTIGFILPISDTAKMSNS